MTMRLWVIGSGGHAKVVIDAARASGRFEIAGVLDDDEHRRGTTVLGAPVLGTADADAIAALGVEHAVIAIGTNALRARIAARLNGLVSWASVVHPTAYIALDATIGSGSVIMAGAIVQPACGIGAHVILNTAASIDHDGTLGDYCHVGPGSRLAGNVRIGEGALLGVGTSVIPGCAIGAWSTIGAGAVVVRDLPARVIASGVPARSHHSRWRAGAPEPGA